MRNFCQARSRLFVWPACLLLINLLTACSTSTALQQARWQYFQGDTAAALATLENSDVVASNDRLLYWLEKGLVLHDAGDYETSTRELLAASSYLERNDFVSVRDEARALLANEWAGRYGGEYSEQLWIHSYLMMNFLALEQYESAAVEARQALARMESHPEVLNSDYFTRALIALSFEAAGQTNDAYIVNRKLASDSGNHGSLDPVLLPQALRLGFSNDAREIQQRIATSHTPDAIKTRRNEIIVFLASGVIPVKKSGNIYTDDYARLSFPQYYISNDTPPDFHVTVDGAQCRCKPINTDLGMLVADSLNKRGLATAAKSIARAVVKDAVADAVGEKDTLAGEFARLILFAIEEADTRSWQSLPRHLTMLRIPLPDNTDTAPVIEINGHSIGSDAPITIEMTEESLFKNGLQFISLRVPAKH